MSSPDDGAGSVSKLDCTAKVRDKGEAKVSVFRHLAPLTVNALARELPIQGRATGQAQMVTMFTTLKVGVEKPRSTFERGDVAFLASGSLLCFFLKSASSDRPLNPIGKVESGIEVLENIRPGDVITLLQTAAKPQSP
ncbi:MAG: hypothetical protein HY296_00845 [Thaumarchaeota archaeon]|nr:hypothetical protein [Nitrososphaerota archaeon]